MKTINDYAELVKEKHALNETIAPVEADETDASKAYAVGEQLILSGILYDVIAPISQHDVITTTGSGANIAPAGPISSKIQTLTNEVDTIVNELGAKNLIHITPRTEISHGLTFTANNKGEVSIVGTHTLQSGTTVFNIFDNQLDAGKYKFSVDGNRLGSCMVLCHDVPTAAGNYKALVTLGTDTPSNELEFIYTEEDKAQYPYIWVQLGVRYSEVNVNTLYKPMIRPSSIIDSSFVPPAKTNRELTQETTGLISNEFVNGAVNLLENKAITQTITTDGANLTVVVDPDTKEITINGIGGSSATTINIQGTSVDTSKFIGKHLKMSGCPLGGSQSTYFMEVYGAESAGSSHKDFGEGVEFTWQNDGSYTARIRIIIGAGVTVTNKVFKPMFTVADMPNSDYNHYVPYAMSNRELMENVLSAIPTKLIKISGVEISDSYNPITIADELVATNSTEIVYVQVGANTNVTNPNRYCPLSYTLYEIRHTGDTVTLNAIEYNPNTTHQIYTIGRSRNGSWGTWYRTTMSAVT